GRVVTPLHIHFVIRLRCPRTVVHQKRRNTIIPEIFRSDPLKFVLEWNHWIAFVLLIFLGGRMIIEGIRGGSDEDETPLRRHS
ncbi:manganese efflux pump, partial [Salmonella enterica subsp. enterica serovar Montevideo]|nr:manganese efflux pump [Salmonella enterica subsp. enterica serovar Montevideo]